MTLNAATLARALEIAASESATLARFVDDLDGWNGSDCDTGSNAAFTLRAMSDASKAIDPNASFAEAAEALALEGLSTSAGHIGVLISGLLASWAHDLGGAKASPVAVRRMLKASLQAPTVRVAPSAAITACLETASEGAVDLGDTLSGTPYLVSWYSMSFQIGLVNATDERTGRVDAGAAVLAIILACLDAAVSDNQDGLQAFARMLSELAERQGVAPQPVPPAPEQAFAVDVLWRATREDVQAHLEALEAMGARLSCAGVVDAFGVGTWRLHVDTSAPLAVRPRTGALLRFQVVDARTDEQLGVDELDEEILTHRGVRLLERRPLRRVERAHVIACTRAPGLVEDLARTGALVLLNPLAEDGVGIAYLNRTSATGATLFVPCDEASYSLGAAITQVINAREDGINGALRMRLAESRDDLTALQIAQECASSFVPQPGGFPARDKMLLILENGAQAAAAHVRSLPIEADVASVAAGVATLAQTGATTFRLLLNSHDGPELVALVQQFLVHENIATSGVGAYGMRGSVDEGAENLEGAELDVIHGGHSSASLLQAVLR